MSSVPWKRAMREEGEQVRVETEAPPRTRSSEAVHSVGDQALWGECSISGLCWVGLV